MKKRKNHHNGIMGRSSIPYAQRLAMQRRAEIKEIRDRAAKIAMYCATVAMHEVEGIGYKRIVRYSKRFDRYVYEFYDDPEVGMAHAKMRMDQMGMEVSGEFFTLNPVGMERKEWELKSHSMQAVQVAMLCCHIAMNDEFGFGKERQTRISDRITELSQRYDREGEGWLLEEMEKIGFHIEGGNAKIYLDENDNPITRREYENQRTD
jgi:hypothetical protein